MMTEEVFAVDKRDIEGDELGREEDKDHSSARLVSNVTTSAFRFSPKRE